MELRCRSRRAALRALVQAALAGSLAFAALGPAVAATLEASVKAAYLYKFTGFVEWPPRAFASTDTPIVIGVVDAPEVLAELEPVLVGRSIHGRPLRARRVIPGETLEGVHMLYVPAPDRLPSGWLASADAQPLLLVTDQPGGLASGGMLNFLLHEGRVRFEASPPAAERAGIRLSARLLAVAERVVP
ncbi:MAG: YfiR family protein [Methylibium sp.]|nr:YfiR family protein [Methylibium sp.]